MSNELRKEVLIVDGMPSTKACIKFTGDENYYDISQKVQGYDLVKYGIVKGATVDVTFDPANQVIYLKKKEGSAPATQQTSAPATTEGDTKMWTVKAVAKNKKVIKFDESEKDWDVVSKEVEALDLTGLGIVPKVVVLVTFDASGTVTAISKSTDEPPVESGGDVEQSKGSYSNPNTTNDSIQRQVCLKESGAIVRSLIEMAREEVNDLNKIKTVLKDVMKTCLDSMNL